MDIPIPKLVEQRFTYFLGVLASFIVIGILLSIFPGSPYDTVVMAPGFQLLNLYPDIELLTEGLGFHHPLFIFPAIVITGIFHVWPLLFLRSLKITALATIILGIPSLFLIFTGGHDLLSALAWPYHWIVVVVLYKIRGRVPRESIKSSCIAMGLSVLIPFAILFSIYQLIERFNMVLLLVPVMGLLILIFLTVSIYWLAKSMIRSRKAIA